jgi:hypothetical protein
MRRALLELELEQMQEQMTLPVRGLATRRAHLELARMQEWMTLPVRGLAAGLQHEPISAENSRLPLDGPDLRKAIHNRQHIVVYIG